MSEGGVQRRIDSRSNAPYRRRRLCIVVAGTRREPARLRDISAAGATLDTCARPALGEAVQLHYPEAGEIGAHVVGHSRDGIRLSFELDDGAVAFALRALAIDMTAPRAV